LTVSGFGGTLASAMEYSENHSHQPGRRTRMMAAVAFCLFLLKGLVWLLAGAGLTLSLW